MKTEDVMKIAKAMGTIHEVMDRYPAQEELLGDEIIAEVNNATGPNFFFSKLEDLIEAQLPLWVREYEWKDYPWEVYTYLFGIEIRCIVTQEQLDAAGLSPDSVYLPKGK